MRRCASVVPLWDKYWNRELAAQRRKKRKVRLSILPTLARVVGPTYAFAMFFQLAYSVMQFASPQVVNLLIDFVESDEPQWKGYFYTALICLATLLTTILSSQCFYTLYIVTLKLRTALVAAIYRKSVKLSNVGRKEMTGLVESLCLTNSEEAFHEWRDFFFSVGETTNLMAIDTQKFMDVTLYLNYIWASPLQIALAMYFLWGMLGPSALAGKIPHPYQSWNEAFFFHGASLLPLTEKWGAFPAIIYWFAINCP